MENKKYYTREQKIRWYQNLILELQLKLRKAEDRLHYIMSDEYQEFSDTLDVPKAAPKKKRA